MKLWTALLCGGLVSAQMAVAEDRRTDATPPRATPPILHPVQYGQCWQQYGPYATQDRAWAVWRQARAQGYEVSNGVTPCWSDGVRGYCFRIYYAC
ncbi:hypothetical protein AB0T83_17135 [Fluviibacterium sp. DFM31]|uniref:Uncharacterized protein n=1 Tax=Meridianimarinicoccus marinus TaxID=3231483 RepID=A0ABV3LAJ1_9RHOB